MFKIFESFIKLLCNTGRQLTISLHLSLLNFFNKVKTFSTKVSEWASTIIFVLHAVNVIHSTL